jgi:hypothetical protein
MENHHFQWVIPLEMAIFNSELLVSKRPEISWKVDIKSYSASWIGLQTEAFWEKGLHLLEDDGSRFSMPRDAIW